MLDYVNVPIDDVASTEDQQFFREFQYSADHGSLLRFPHFCVGHSALM